MGVLERRREDLRSFRMDGVLNYVGNLESGSHGVFFYRNHGEKHGVLFHFLQCGLKKGEGAVYVASQETSGWIRKQMADYGVDVDALEKDGVLRIFECREWYMKDGKVDIPRMRLMANQILDEALEMGLKGLRVCGEVACFFEHQKERELVEYELGIGRKLDLPVAALCSYDTNHVLPLQNELFLDIVRAHGLIVTSIYGQKIEFEELFPKTVYEVLENIFGEMGKATILKLLRNHYSLTPQKICENPELLTRALNGLIGSGGQTVTRNIMTRLQSEIGIT